MAVREGSQEETKDWISVLAHLQARAGSVVWPLHPLVSLAERYSDRANLSAVSNDEWGQVCE